MVRFARDPGRAAAHHATFRQRDGQTLHVRKATVAEPDLRQIYDALQIDPAPGGIRKYLA